MRSRNWQGKPYASIALSAIMLVPMLGGCLEYTEDTSDSARRVRAGEDVELESALALALPPGSGSYAFRVTGDGPLVVAFTISMTWRTDDYAPLDVTLVSETNGFEPLISDIGIDNAQWGKGDGVVYAGAAGSTASSPSLLPQSWDLRGGRYHQFNASTGVLVLAWANQPDFIQFASLWGTGTEFEDLGAHPAIGVEMKEFAGGARAGTPVLGANIEDKFALNPTQGANYGSITYLRSNVAKGSIRVTSTGLDETISLEGPLDVGDRGLAYDRGQALFSATGRVNLDLEFVGYSRTTKLYGLFVDLPPSILPSPLWQHNELIEFSPSPGGRAV